MAPFLRSLQAHAAGKEEGLPKRFVFVVKSSGVEKFNLVPEGIENHFLGKDGEKLGNRGRKLGEAINVSLNDQKLPDKLAALEPFKDRVTIIQSLSGDTFRGNHTSGFGALSCHFSERVAIAPSVDCLLGQHLSAGPYPMYGMALKGGLLEAGGKPADSYCYPNLSAYKGGMPVAYQASPRKAYLELFGAAVDTPKQVARKLALNGSMMDFLKDDARRIERQLSAEDKDRFAVYTDSFESLQKIERKKAKLTGKIKKHAPSLSDRYDSQFPSDRIASHFEIASAALIAGMTNVLTLRVDTLGVTYKELGIQKHVHALGHNDPGISSNGWDGLRCRMEIEKLHLKYIANMAQKLDRVPEGNGTMLDNTLIVYMSCNGGDHHGGQADWPFVLLGGMANKLNMGRYIEYPKHRETGHRTIANLYLSFMQAAGMEPPETFGQLDANLKDLDLSGPLHELMVS
ncbi:DUF1552 domain-containing protein [bacterium]|nr:DUF1552 domain-containing protein [bacterium]